jgi:hypothetical protein
MRIFTTAFVLCTSKPVFFRISVTNLGIAVTPGSCPTIRHSLVFSPSPPKIAGAQRALCVHSACSSCCKESVITARPARDSLYDTIAGAVLVIAGLIAAVVRLEILDLGGIPLSMAHWWPLMLIIAGLAPWHEQMKQTAAQRGRQISEAKHGI